MAAVVLPLPGPVFTMMSPRRMSAMPESLILLEGVSRRSGRIDQNPARWLSDSGQPVRPADKVPHFVPAADVSNQQLGYRLPWNHGCTEITWENL
jgi:hypothetical protein